MKCFKCPEEAGPSGLCQKCWDLEQGIIGRIGPKPIKTVEYKNKIYDIFLCKVCGLETSDKTLLCHRRECIDSRPTVCKKCGKPSKHSYCDQCLKEYALQKKTIKIDSEPPEAIVAQLIEEKKDE
jgi:hypothetical protein